MLNSIIPPILVILSLVAIIIFLMKKAPRVAMIDDETKRPKRRLFWKKNESASDHATRIDIKHRALGVLEKIIGKLKWLFFGIGRQLTRWSEAIKEKRKRKVEEIKDFKKSEEEREIEEKIVMFERKSIQKENENITVEEKIVQESIIEEKIQKPLVGEPVISRILEEPAPKPEFKEHLEKILIDRIASNPKDIEAYERLGEYYMEIENWGYAKECFKQIVKLDPKNKNVKTKMRQLERLLTQ